MSKACPQYKINNQTILQEHIDESYEPTEEEIHEYASYIGIDLEKEPELLWLAREGLMKPLPTGWKACQEENGELYYFNFDTGKSSWDHPYDEIYKARVVQAREKKSLATIMIDSHSKGKNTLSISELSSERNPYNVKNETGERHGDSQEINSESDVELNNSDNDNEQSSNGFQEDVDFGIDRQLSARLEHERDEPPPLTPASHAASFIDTPERPVENKKNDVERVRVASLAADAAERRLSTSKPTIEENVLITPREDFEVAALRKRLEQSANEEKLQLLEDNRIHIEKLKAELQSIKEQEERTLRERMKAELTVIGKTFDENLAREKRLLATRQQNELNLIKQVAEREKQELQKKLRADMLADLNLDQQDNVNMHIRLLQIKHEYEEKLRNAESGYRSEIEDLTRRCEKSKLEKETLEKRLKEKNDVCSTIQRTMDQLRGEKSSLERKLQDAEIELKAVVNNHRQKPVSLPRKSSASQLDDDDNSNLEQSLSNMPTVSHDDDDEGLSDTDSDIIEMKQTLNALKHMSFLPTPTKPATTTVERTQPKSSTIDFGDLAKHDTSPVLRSTPFERTPNTSLLDSGRWSNTMPTKIGNSTYPVGMQTSYHSPATSKTNYWQSQPSLITREAVLKAARDVLPPGVIDHLTSTH